MNGKCCMNCPGVLVSACEQKRRESLTDWVCELEMGMAVGHFGAVQQRWVTWAESFVSLNKANQIQSEVCKFFCSL